MCIILVVAFRKYMYSGETAERLNTIVSPFIAFAAIKIIRKPVWVNKLCIFCIHEKDSWKVLLKNVNNR